MCSSRPFPVKLKLPNAYLRPGSWKERGQWLIRSGEKPYLPIYQMRGQGDFRAISIALLPNLAKNKAFLQFWLCSTPAKDTPFQESESALGVFGGLVPAWTSPPPRNADARVDRSKHPGVLVPE